MSLQIGLSIVAQAVHKALAGVSATVTPIHSLDLTTAPSASNSFDDYGLATSRTVTDYNGRIVQIPADAVPMGGLRPVRNYMSSDFSNGDWTVTGGTLTDVTGTVAPPSGEGVSADIKVFRLQLPASGSTYAVFVHPDIGVGEIFADHAVFSLWVRAVSTTSYFDIGIRKNLVYGYLDGGAGKSVTETWERVSIYVEDAQANSVTTALLAAINNGNDTNATDIYICAPMLQDITHRADLSTAPDEFVSVGVQTGDPYYTAPSWTGKDYDSHTDDGEGGYTAEKTTGGGTAHSYSTAGVPCVAGEPIGIEVTISELTVANVRVGLSSGSNARSDVVEIATTGTHRLTVTPTITGTWSISITQTLLGVVTIDTASCRYFDPGQTGVDGFRYFTTALANTVDGSGVVTEGTGASIEGWGDYQPGATNLLTHSNDLSQASWFVTASGAGAVSPTKTAAYADGPLGEDTANRMQLNRGTDASGYSVTYKQATLSNATNYCGSVYLKSLSGTPTVCVYLTGNAYSGITGLQLVTLSADAWTRVDCTGLTTSANPANFTIGLLGSSYVSGASQTADILVSAAQLETGTVPTAYIPTSGTSASRPAMSPAPTISGLVGTEDARLTVKGVGPELVTNGTFDTDTTGWTPVNATLSVDAGRLKVTTTAGYGAATQTIAMTAGQSAWISFTTTNGSAPALFFAQNGTIEGNLLTATSNNPVLWCRANNPSIGVTAFFDDISIRVLDPVDTTSRIIDLNNIDGEFDMFDTVPIKVLSIDVYNDGERPA